MAYNRRMAIISRNQQGVFEAFGYQVFSSKRMQSICFALVALTAVVVLIMRFL